MGNVWNQLVSKGIEDFDPSQVKIEINHTCNLRCSHCYIDSSNKTRLSADNLARLFDELLDMNCLLIALTGGEPLLHPELHRIIEEISGRGFVLELLTNGCLIDPPLARFFRLNNVRKVQVSLYGHQPSVHDSVTWVPGSFERTVQGIRYLKEAGLQVGLACSLIKSNYRHWSAIREFAEKDLGFRLEMSYWIIDNPPSRKRIDEVRLSPKEVIHYLSELYLSLDVAQPTPPTTEDLEERICLAGINNCRILPNGDVIPCSRIEQPLGNILKSTFRDIWETAPFAQHLRRLYRKDLKQCSRCDYYSICPICPGYSYQDTGDFLHVKESVCEYVRADGELRRQLFPGKEVKKV